MQIENVTLRPAWALALAADIAAASWAVNITTLSFQIPRHPNDTPHGQLIAQILAAPLRGVRVNVSMPAPSKTHAACAFNLLSAKTLADAGCFVWWAPPANLLHAKTAVIDDNIAWVGSGNYTAAAANHNRECYMRAASHQLARDLLMHWKQCGIPNTSEALTL